MGWVRNHGGGACRTGTRERQVDSCNWAFLSDQSSFSSLSTVNHSLLASQIRAAPGFVGQKKRLT